MPPQLQFEEDHKNERVAAMLQRLFEERSGLHGGYNNDIASWGDLMENVDSGAKEVVRGGMIMNEVEKFRLAQEERAAQLEAKRLALIQEKLRRDKEDAERGASDSATKGQDPPTAAVSSSSPNKDDSRRSSPSRRSDRRRRSRSRSRDRERRYRDSRRRRSRSRSGDRGSRHARTSPDTSARGSEATRPSAPPAPTTSSLAATPATHESAATPPPLPPPRVMAKIELKLQKKDKADGKPATTSAPSGVTVFGVDDDDTAKPQRKFVPLDYTDEEKLAASVEAQVARTVARINSRSDGVEGIIRSIPTDKKGLFRFPVDWTAVDKLKLVELKMKPWVNKKIVEYLGEEEESLIGFVLRQLNQHTAAQAIVDELVPVLEHDAEIFVVTMWRKLIFEMLRAAAGN
ncbi:hypothetical protein, variant [Aphanomyces astaci]|nr:hypothetical protein, variant [Aphanomyces astaci]ETV87742.1 hypothetical protein, variant [Aphanomyces astaci]|eukprot:XP_009822605.1 hypothetical protein, variant [Aphanomyces astaci]